MHVGAQDACHGPGHSCGSAQPCTASVVEQEGSAKPPKIWQKPQTTQHLSHTLPWMQAAMNTLPLARNSRRAPRDSSSVPFRDLHGLPMTTSKPSGPTLGVSRRSSIWVQWDISCTSRPSGICSGESRQGASAKRWEQAKQSGRQERRAPVSCAGSGIAGSRDTVRPRERRGCPKSQNAPCAENPRWAPVGDEPRGCARTSLPEVSHSSLGHAGRCTAGLSTHSHHACVCPKPSRVLSTAGRLLGRLPCLHDLIVCMLTLASFGPPPLQRQQLQRMQHAHGICSILFILRKKCSPCKRGRPGEFFL